MTSKSGKFLKCVEDNFLSKVLSEPARRGALLDPLFENREGILGKLTVGSCFGSSDHELVVFNIFGVRIKKFSVGCSGL